MNLEERFRQTLMTQGWQFRSLDPADLVPRLREFLSSDGPGVAGGNRARRACTEAGLPLVDRPDQEPAWGVVDATFGIADPGSVVLRIAPDLPRWLPLLPPRLVVLLRAEDLLADLDAFWQTPGVRTASWLFLHGPSVTADIEKVLVHGVHGPAEVHLWLLRNAGNA